MASITKMHLRLNYFDPRVKAELFTDAGHWRIIVYVDGVRKGYLTRAPHSGRFAFWQSGWHWAPEYTPTQFELMVRNYLHNNPL